MRGKRGAKIRGFHISSEKLLVVRRPFVGKLGSPFLYLKTKGVLEKENERSTDLLAEWEIDRTFFIFCHCCQL